MKDLFLLDPSVVYLNHGTFGACPRPVFDTYQALQLELERQPIEFLALERRFPALLDAARRELAAYVGAPPDDLVFATNTSSALNAVIRSLPLGPGDEVLLGDAEYGGLEILWRFVAEQTGAKLRRAPFAELEPAPDTRVVFAHTSSGRQAASTTSQRCARRPAQWGHSRSSTAPMPRARFHSNWLRSGRCLRGELPQVALRAERLGVSLRTAERPDVIEPLVISWDWVDGAPFQQRHRWQGTRDPAALLAVPAAIAFQAEHDWPSVRRRCHALLDRFRDECALEPLTDEYVQMLGFRVPVTDGTALKQALYERHRIEVPVVETKDGWAMRVSIQGYNDDSDVDALLAALEDLL